MSVFASWTGCGRSDGERRLGRENVVLQQQRNSCGPAALSMLLAFHGIAASEEDLERQMQPGRDGVSLRAIVEVADRYGVGLETWRLRVDTVDAIETPAILWIDGDHFVVLDSVNATGIFVRDPARGRLQWTMEGLRTRWDGTAAVPVRTP